MKGVIEGKDVVRHAAVIVRAWGVAAWLSCLWAVLTRRDVTFLGVLHPAPRPAGAGPEGDRCRGRAARPGAIILAAAVSGGRSSPLVLASPSGPGSRWRRSR